MPRVLFVCTGNICRSPMAQALLRNRLDQEGLSDWEVESAGTWTVEGAPASKHTVWLMAERGLDLASHRSRSVDRCIIERADLVLVMTQSHAEALRLEFSDLSSRIFLLSEMREGHCFDIPDPYGGSLAEYRSSAKLIAHLIDAGFERIRSLAEDKDKTGLDG